VENIGDPLMHMIRNSVDHGIEPAEEREKAGKRR
jgi:two-component system chemotaxis sensor kinase CheA